MHEQNELLLATLHIRFLIPEPKNKTGEENLPGQNTLRNSNSFFCLSSLQFHKKEKTISIYRLANTHVFTVQCRQAWVPAEVGRRVDVTNIGGGDMGACFILLRLERPPAVGTFTLFTHIWVGEKLLAGRDRLCNFFNKICLNNFDFTCVFFW